MTFSGLSPAKLIGIGVGALALIGLIVMVLGWRSERNELRVWQSDVYAATKEASANPKLTKKDTAQQIRLLGTAIADLKAAIARQNAAVNALAAESERQKGEAAKAVSRAATRARASEATSERLLASSRSTARSSGPQGQCEPSKELKEAWR